MAISGTLSLDIKINDSQLKAIQGDVSRIQSSIQKAGSSIGNSFKFGAIASAGSKAFSFLGSTLGDVVKRSDQLERFPKIMQMMGASAEEASQATKTLSDGIQGLPTSLDAIQPLAQSLQGIYKDANKASKGAVALNDAFLASGSSGEKAQRGIEQFTQMLAVGKPDMQAWHTLLETMGPAIDKVAKSFGKADAQELYTSLKKGQISMDQFLDKFVELDGGMDGFAKNAKTASAGISTSFANMRTSVVNSLTTMLKELNADKALTQFAEGFKIGMNEFTEGFKKTMVGVKSFFSSLNGGKTPKWLNNLPETLGRIAPALIASVLGFTLLGKTVGTLGGIFNKTKSSLTGLMNAFKSGGNKSPSTFKGLQSDLIKAKTEFIKTKSLFMKGLTFTVKAIGVAIVISSLALLAKSLEGIANAGKQAPDNLAAFSIAVGGLAGILGLMGEKLTKSSKGIIAFASSISIIALAMEPIAQTGFVGADAMNAFGVVVSGLVGVFALFGSNLKKSALGIAAFALSVSGIAVAMTPIAQSGNEGAKAMIAFAESVSIMAGVLAVLGPLLKFGAAGILAFGGAILMVGAGIGLASAGVAILVTAFTGLAKVIPPIISALSELANVILSGISGVIDSVSNSFTTFAGAMERLNNVNLSKIAGGMGEIALAFAGNAVSGLLGNLTNISGQLMKFANAAKTLNAVNFNKVSSGISTLKTSISTFGNISTKGFETSIGKIKTSMGKLKKVFSGDDGITSSMNNLKNNMKGFSDSFSGLQNVDLTSITKQLPLFKQAVQDLVSIDLGGLKGKMEELGTALSDLTNNLKGGLFKGAGFDEIAGALQTFARAVKQLTEVNFDIVKEGISKLKEGIADLMTVDTGSLKTKIDDIKEALGGLMTLGSGGDIKGAMKGGGIGAFTEVAKSMKTLASGLTTIQQLDLGAMKQNFIDLKSAIDQMMQIDTESLDTKAQEISDAMSKISSIFSGGTLGNVGSGFGGKGPVGGGTTDILTSVTDFSKAIQTFAESLNTMNGLNFEGINTGLSDLKTKLEDLGQIDMSKIAEGFGNINKKASEVLDKLKTIVDEKIKAAIRTAELHADGFAAAGTSLGNALKNAFENAASGIQEIAQRIGQNAANSITSAINDAKNSRMIVPGGQDSQNNNNLAFAGTPETFSGNGLNFNNVFEIPTINPKINIGKTKKETPNNNKTYNPDQNSRVININLNGKVISKEIVPDITKLQEMRNYR